MLLSSVAETMLWTGRYLERARALSKVVQGYERLSLDLPGVRSLDLRPLLCLVGRAGAGQSEGQTLSWLQMLVLDADNPSSVNGAVGRARANLRQGRVAMPPEVWEALNTLHVTISDVDPAKVTSVLGVLEEVVRACGRVEGELAAGMTRDAAYAFLRVGRYLERMDMLVRTVEALLPELVGKGSSAGPFDDIRWMGVLQIVGALTMYCRRHHATVDLPKVLDFIVLDAAFPRSLAHGLVALEAELEKLPRSEQTRAALEACKQDALTLAAASADDLGTRLSCMLSSFDAVQAALQDAYFPGHIDESKRPAVHEPSGACAWATARSSCPDRVGEANTYQARAMGAGPQVS